MKCKTQELDSFGNEAVDISRTRASLRVTKQLGGATPACDKEIGTEKFFCEAGLRGKNC
jgi:hypothetical protein